MAGTKKGGVKASVTNKQRYGDNFYKVIGAVGGTKSNNGGFAAHPELASAAGRKGGIASRRPKAGNEMTVQYKQTTQEIPIDTSRNTTTTLWGRLFQKIRG